MTTGLQTATNPLYREILLLEAQPVTAIPLDGAAGSSSPLSATPGPTGFYDLRLLAPPTNRPLGDIGLDDDCEVLVENAAGTGTVTATVRLWLYYISTGLAYPWGIGADADKGKLNNGAAMGAVDTNKLRHRETVPGPGLADGIMAQVVSSTGTGTETFNVRILIPVNTR